MSRTSSGKRGRSSRSARWIDAVVVPRAGALLVLLVGDPEQDHGADADADERVDLADDVVDRPAAHRRQRLVRLGRRPDEERHDEVLEVEPRLAHERRAAHRFGAAGADG